MKTNNASLLEKRDGASFKGYLIARYTDLVALYGEPMQNSRDYKTDAEWIVETPHGIATIYNYKNGKSYLGKDGLNTEDICEWHVGGKSTEAYLYVHSHVLNQAKERFTD